MEKTTASLGASVVVALNFAYSAQGTDVRVSQTASESINKGDSKMKKITLILVVTIMAVFNFACVAQHADLMTPLRTLLQDSNSLYDSVKSQPRQQKGYTFSCFTRTIKNFKAQDPQQATITLRIQNENNFCLLMEIQNNDSDDIYQWYCYYSPDKNKINPEAIFAPYKISKTLNMFRDRVTIKNKKKKTEEIEFNITINEKTDNQSLKFFYFPDRDNIISFLFNRSFNDIVVDFNAKTFSDFSLAFAELQHRLYQEHMKPILDR